MTAWLRLFTSRLTTYSRSLSLHPSRTVAKPFPNRSTRKARSRKEIQPKEINQSDRPSFRPSPRKGQPETGNQHKKGTTAMIPQTINEPRDSIIYGYATGWAHLRAVADPGQCAGLRGQANRRRSRPDSRSPARGIQRTRSAVREGCDQLSDECDDDGDCCRTYSDGSPVYSPFAPLDSFHPLRPPNGLTALRIDEESNRLSAARTRSCNLIWRWGRSDARCKRSCRATRKPRRHPSCCAM
jgi:hypothetical protein